MRLYENTDLTPLEIWHGQTSMGPLYEMTDDQISIALSEFLLKMHDGHAKTIYESDSLELSHAKDFEAVFLTGGKASFVYESLLKTNFPFAIELVENLSGLSDFDLTIDWGQTSIKTYFGNERKITPRDLDLFPVRCSVKTKDTPVLNSQIKLRNYFKNIVQPTNCKSAAVALPVKISPNLIAEPSTYEGLEGDLKILFDDLGLKNMNIEFMNDAVLAARQVREKRVKLPPKSLVLTLGYGVGAAVWRK
jgi:hypothetical protein